MKLFFAKQLSGILLGKKLLWRQVWNLEVEYLNNLQILTNAMGSRQKSWAISGKLTWLAGKWTC